MVFTLISNAAGADPEDTFRPYVRGQYIYDGNLFRLQNDQAASAVLGTTDTAESYHTLAAGMDMNLRISRQAIKMHAEFNQTRFNKYPALDSSGHDAALQWDWLLGSVVAGDVGIAESVTLGSFANVNQPTDNVVRTRKGFFHAAIMPGNSWQVKFGWDRIHLRNDDSVQKIFDSTVDTLGAGVQYQTTKDTLIEVVSQFSEGKYPQRQIIGSAPVDNGYTQWGNGIGAHWLPSGKIRLSGRVNATRRSYVEVPQRDFSGLTGRLSLDWKGTEKTTWTAALYRDVGTTENSTTSYTVNQGMVLGADWKSTAKLVFDLQISRSRSTYTGDPGLVLAPAPPREDRYSSVRIGGRYNVWRNTLLGLVMQRGVRDSSLASAGYGYNSAMLTLHSEF